MYTYMCCIIIIYILQNNVPEGTFVQQQKCAQKFSLNHFQISVDAKIALSNIICDPCSFRLAAAASCCFLFSAFFFFFSAFFAFCAFCDNLVFSRAIVLVLALFDFCVWAFRKAFKCCALLFSIFSAVAFIVARRMSCSVKLLLT